MLYNYSVSLAYHGLPALNKSHCNAPMIQELAVLAGVVFPVDPLNRNTPVVHNVSTAAAHMQQITKNVLQGLSCTKGLITRLSKDALVAIRKAGRLAFQQEQAKSRLNHQAASPHTSHQPSNQSTQELANRTRALS